MENQPKTYDLEERTYLFAKQARAFLKRLPRTVCNLEDVKQLVRASGSVGSAGAGAVSLGVLLVVVSAAILLAVKLVPSWTRFALTSPFRSAPSA